jgi:ubiquinone biosynthesis UbiH/UbiF/VisC/COQ6 family hydroxylase
MDYDILVAGAGPAGLCLARALEPSGLTIGVLEVQEEPALSAPAYDGREIALTHLSAQLLRRYGVWDRFAANEISTLRDARVMDGSGRTAMDLHHRDSGKSELGYLVSNHVIRRAAWDATRGQERLTLRTGARVTGVQVDATSARVRLASGEQLESRLLVAADSRFSESRRAVGIPATMRDYGKTMLVCRMEHEASHDEVAVEWFGYGQTVALLPLQGRRCSVVLTLPDQLIRALVALPEAEFEREIERRLDRRLGAMRLDSGRYPYPLVGVYPSRLVASRFAAIGDAAVGMHPVTAHGFNFGLRGIDTLVREISACLRAGRDFAGEAPLARYERAHRAATRPLYLATQAIVALYTNDSPPAKIVRELLLRFGSRLAPFRKAIVSTLAEERPARN